jgi:hypothetical protein
MQLDAVFSIIVVLAAGWAGNTVARLLRLPPVVTM